MRKYTAREVKLGCAAQDVLSEACHAHTSSCECGLCAAWWKLCEIAAKGIRSDARVEVPGYLNG